MEREEIFALAVSTATSILAAQKPKASELQASQELYALVQTSYVQLWALNKEIFGNAKEDASK